MAPIAQGIKQAMQAVSDPKLAGDPDKIRALEAEIAELRRLLDQAPQDTKEEQTAKSELEEALRQIEALLKTQTEQEQKIKSLEDQLNEAQRQVQNSTEGVPATMGANSPGYEEGNAGCFGSEAGRGP